MLCSNISYWETLIVEITHYWLFLNLLNPNALKIQKRKILIPVKINRLYNLKMKEWNSSQPGNRRINVPVWDIEFLFLRMPVRDNLDFYKVRSCTRGHSWREGNGTWVKARQLAPARSGLTGHSRTQRRKTRGILKTTM